MDSKDSSKKKQSDLHSSASCVALSGELKHINLSSRVLDALH